METDGSWCGGGWIVWYIALGDIIRAVGGHGDMQAAGISGRDKGLLVTYY